MGDKKSELPYSREDRALLRLAVSAAEMSIAYARVVPAMSAVGPVNVLLVPLNRNTPVPALVIRPPPTLSETRLATRFVPAPRKVRLRPARSRTIIPN